MGIVIEGKSDTSQCPARHVSELTGAKVRIFLAQVAEGVSEYRSLHSLTQQVEHQYHGRFLIELIQNAHDALAGVPSADNPNRIEIVFDPTDSLHGSLLVANDGLPFSASNFERLAHLGQSDKDPQKSIGNKGIGFRSVLEVSAAPEVYSRLSKKSNTFDGYCFAFRPQVVDSLVGPIVELAKGGPVPFWPETGEALVDWSGDMLVKYRRRVERQSIEWLIGETRYLSPYLLPVPLTHIQSTAVNNFEQRGFATVVRLPLKSESLRAYVLEQIGEVSSSTVLFLERVGLLTLRVPGVPSREFSRTTTALYPNESFGERVCIEEDGGASLEYAVWTRRLHVPDAPEAFRQAVRALPGRWPEIEDIAVSVAVRWSGVAEAGRFSIYLPTLLATGCAAHVNAPFFGDMSRTSIPFDDAYNRQLLQTAGELALEVARDRLAGRGESEALAIVDLLAPYGDDPIASKRWLSLIEEATSSVSALLDDEPLLLANAGWRALNETSLLPTLTEATILTAEMLRRHAAFEVFHRCLEGRKEQLHAWALSRYGEPGAFPLTSHLASTIASVARELWEVGGDWNEFWRDVMRLLPNGQADLAMHEILLGTDGKLHRAGAQSGVFFLRRQGTQDDSEAGEEGGTAEVPPSLQPHVAFLSDRIQVYEPEKPTQQTAVRAYLGKGLVAQFRVEPIFTGILKELTPALPVALNGPHAALCSDLLRWALRLVDSAVSRGRGSDAMLRLLRPIPVPCEGGWYPMTEATFGPNWPETRGVLLHSYLKALSSAGAVEARKRLLLPPEHPTWGGVGPGTKHLLLAGGVFDGLRLHEVRADAWDSGFYASQYFLELPNRAPPNFTEKQWESYRTLAGSGKRPSFSSSHLYAVGTLYTFPGFMELETMPEPVRVRLSELILESLPRWGQGLEPLVLAKQSGYSERLSVTSPLKDFLQTTPWLAIQETNRLTWARPADRWHVPGDALAGRARHFAHLKPLPAGLAQRLDRNPELAGALRNLGMQHFDLQATTSSPKLVEALTAAVASDDVADPNVLLGQLREAWGRYRPETGQPALSTLAVRRRDKRLEAVTPTGEMPVYLPDSGVYVNELEQLDFPVLTIYPNDAKALKDWFVAAYGARVQPTSALELVPHVNGETWCGVSAATFAESELGRLIPVLLALVAFHGALRGIHSPAFKQRSERLRESRVDWVPNVHVAVLRADTILTSMEVDAVWDAPRKTLIAGESCRMHPERLGKVLAQALERDDLELPLRFALRGLESIDAVPEDVASFLEPLDISTEQVLQVMEHLRGDVGHMVRLLQVLVAVLKPTADVAALAASKTEDELQAHLEAETLANLDIPQSLLFARECEEMFEFGRRIFTVMGELVALPRWNATLVNLGRPQISNRNWATELQAGLEEGSGLIKRVFAHLISQGLGKSYRELLAAYDHLPSEHDLSRTHWRVDFGAAMEVVASYIRSLCTNEPLVEAVKCAGTLEELRLRLSQANIPLDVDPDDCSRRNGRLIESTAEQIEKLHLAWLLKFAPEKLKGERSGVAHHVRLVAADALARDGVTRIWEEADIFSMLRQSEAPAEMSEFWATVKSVSDLSTLQAALEVSDDELAQAQTKLAQLKAEAAKRQNVVKVCGEDFDSSEENLSQLWSFLQAHIPDAMLAQGPPLELGKKAKLASFKPSGRKPRNDTSRQPGKRPTRQPKAVDELIGLAGEIFVYRMLQQTYGIDVISPSAWVSENSWRVYPLNTADDKLGCDFAFTFKGRSYRIEVKSTAGDDEAFTLGSSEIRLAMDLGRPGKRRRATFLLVHVRQALSASPRAVILPNPYDPKFAGQFGIEEADARVRYRVKE